MDKYIKKEEAIRALLNDAPEQVSYSREDAADCIRYMDAADVAPVRHGRWEHDHYENCCDSFEIVKCSCCGHQAYAIAFYVKSGNYCPNCGAKMDGGADHEA